MLKLIKLEWKKNNIGKYIRNAVILAAILCLFMYALAYLGNANDPDTGVPDAVRERERKLSVSWEKFFFDKKQICINVLSELLLFCCRITYLFIVFPI